MEREECKETIASQENGSGCRRSRDSKIDTINIEKNMDSLSKRSENLRYSFGKATVPLSCLKLNEAENNSKIEGELPKDEQQELDTLLRIFNVGERNESNNPFGYNSNKVSSYEQNENNDPNISMINTHHPSSQLKSQIDFEFQAASNKLNMSNEKIHTPNKNDSSSSGSCENKETKFDHKSPSQRVFKEFKTDIKYKSKINSPNNLSEQFESLLKTENRVLRDNSNNNFKSNFYSKEKFAEQTGVSFVLPKEATKCTPFNLSQSNLGIKNNYFDTYVERADKHKDWPTSSPDKAKKRRSVSQQFVRNQTNDQLTESSAYRVTFMNHPGIDCEVPSYTTKRAESRCEQCHCHVAEIDKDKPFSFKAREMPKVKEFVLKKPIRKPTVPVEPKLNTNARSKEREIFAKNAEKRRFEIKQKELEEKEQKLRDITPKFNLNF